jgi:hypothetical protein
MKSPMLPADHQTAMRRVLVLGRTRNQPWPHWHRWP